MGDLAEMLKELKADYLSYKQRSFGEQVLRVSNTMFSVFAFWNLVRLGSAASEGEFSVKLSLIAVGAVAVGIAFGILLLIRLTAREQLLLLPLAIAAFTWSNDQDTVSRLCSIPVMAFVTQFLIHAIVAMANRVNRL